MKKQNKIKLAVTAVVSAIAGLLGTWGGASGTYMGVLSLANSTVYQLFGETATGDGVGIRLVVDASGHLILRAYINTGTGAFVYPEFTLAFVVVEELASP